MLYAALKIEFSLLSQYEGEYEYIGRLFSYFFSMFGAYFNYEAMAIKFTQKEDEQIPEIIPKLYCNINPSQDPKILWVYDPLAAENNTTQKAFRYWDVQKTFKDINHIIFDAYQQIYYYQEPISEISILNRII